MEIEGVEEGGRLEFSRKARTIQKGTNFNRQSVVVYFCTAVLGGAICAGGLNNISKILNHCVAEGLTLGKFAALIHPDESGASTVFCHGSTQDCKWGVLSLGEEAPFIL